MTTSLPTREADGRSFLESFPRWATDARTVLAVLGIVLYAVLRIAYSLFYNNFGLTPDDLGLSYLDLLIQSAVGTVILLMVMFVVAALVVAVYVGMFGQLRMQWNNFFRQRHAGSSGSERPPSAKEEGESVPPRSPDFRLLKIGEKNRARWVRGLAAIALATLGFAILLLFARAESDATRVQDGHASSFTVLGFRVTTWGAEDATVSLTSNQIAADLRPLAGRCLMYLGQSNGTAFLYLVSTHEVFRVAWASGLAAQQVGCVQRLVGGSLMCGHRLLHAPRHGREAYGCCSIRTRRTSADCLRGARSSTRSRSGPVPDDTGSGEATHTSTRMLLTF